MLVRIDKRGFQCCYHFVDRNHVLLYFYAAYKFLLFTNFYRGALVLLLMGAPEAAVAPIVASNMLDVPFAKCAVTLK